MRRLYALLATGLLASCALTGPVEPPRGLPSIPASPAAVADRTKADEVGLAAVELSYKAARLAVEAGVDAGKIKGQRAAWFQQRNREAWAAVQAAKAAYDTANATSYADALAKARAAAARLLEIAQP